MRAMNYHKARRLLAAHDGTVSQETQTLALAKTAENLARECAALLTENSRLKADLARAHEETAAAVKALAQHKYPRGKKGPQAKA